jgi:lipid kinase YegS
MGYAETPSGPYRAEFDATRVLKMPAKTCLVLHKKSCTRPEVEAAVKHVQQSGIDVDVYIPWSREDLRRFVRGAVKNGAQRIVAGGGDGTLNAVVNAMIREDVCPKASLGILPLGTANDFARGAGIDAKDLMSALELACTGNPTKIDVGRMNDQYFINVASAGFGAEVTATTPQDMKRLLGGVAYSLMGFVKTFQLEPYEGRLILPDGVVKEGSMLIMAVGNGRFAGGGYEVAPRASLTDGLLDIAVVSGLLPEDLNRIVRELRDPMNPRNEYLLYRQLSAFTIETDKPLHVNLDGEPIKGTHFEFRCIPKALSVVLGDA